jgi:hypothetical protein
MKNTHTYIHETHAIWANDGEVHIKDEKNTITFNARNLLRDLEPMLYFAIKEVNKENKDLKDRLKETIKTL